jgi:hypothetical protein
MSKEKQCDWKYVILSMIWFIFVLLENDFFPPSNIEFGNLLFVFWEMWFAYWIIQEGRK